jgi:beta-lactamase class D
MMHKASLRLITICYVLFTGISISSAYAADWEESAKLSTIFKNSGMDGTFILYDVTSNKYIGHNKNRAESRFVPASTFKIPNSLIGLSVGAVKGVDEIIPYRGDSKPFIKAWAKDMGLRESIVLSNVPIYQELARRIGLERMRDGIERLDYGNKQIGTTVDTFWLTGPLKISAIEQTIFLARLAQGTLPFPQENQSSVREITLLERGTSWELHGKTGWENAPGKGVGWWVGWVHKNNRTYAFALNIDIEKESDASKRIELGKACLKALELL